MDYFHDELAGRDARDNFFAKRLLLDVVDELLYDFIVDVRIEQDLANFAQHLRNVRFGNSSFSAKPLENRI